MRFRGSKRSRRKSEANGCIPRLYSPRFDSLEMARDETPRQRLVEACKRVPQGVVCLFSALRFHELILEEPEAAWMMIDTKARTPQIDPSLPIDFVLASGGPLALENTNNLLEISCKTEVLSENMHKGG
jgi:hypothetical protein